MAVSLARILCLKSIVLPFILFHLQVAVTRLKVTSSRFLLHLCLITTQMDAVLFNSHCLFLSSFQLKTMGFGRTVSPMNVVHCCLKPSITCWNAASWIAALFALGSGLWNPTKRTRSLLTRGMLTERLLGFLPCCLFMFILWCACLSFSRLVVWAWRVCWFYAVMCPCVVQAQSICFRAQEEI